MAWVEGEMTALGKNTTGGQMGKIRDFPGNRWLYPGDFCHSCGVTLNQFLRIRMHRPMENVSHRSVFHHFPAIHDDHEIAQFGNHPQVV